MIALELAAPQDADVLTALQTRTFDHDSRQHGHGERGGPPGYDSADWQIKSMRQGTYYKILEDGALIGGAIIFDQGGGHIYLGRIYLAPECQNRGVGAQALALLEAEYPSARRWTLDTPTWALRNQHFYERQGYVKVGEGAIPGEDFGLVLYEKRV
jgi:GNAT superfamily N-acetyltransferase